MPKGPRARATSALPSRDDILGYLARESERGAKIGKREIARAFAVQGADRIGLKALLKEMAAQGLLERHRKAISSAGALPATLVATIAGTTRDGDLFAIPADWDAATQGAAPRILIPLQRRAKAGEAAPGARDDVLLHIEKSRAERDFPYVGRIIRVIPREKNRTLGILRMQKDGSGRLVPIDKKAQGRELSIAEADLGEARDGDLVSVALLDAGRGRQGLSRAKVRERLGSLGSEKAVSLIALYAHGIPHVFSPAALSEAARVRPASLEGREDWRSVPLVTIDPPDAKDHDDAVQAMADTDPKNPGGFVLRIAIADVAAYVHQGSALDREALERGNSVYFPDRVVPMLPERISNDLCSLRPHEDRPALALETVIDAQGRKLRHAFHRVMMRSAARLAYAQAQAAIDGAPDETTRPLLADVIHPLYAAYSVLKKARAERRPLDLDLPERKLLLKPDGTLDRVVVPPRLEAHRLIEEFMILADVCAAETLERAHVPLLYRVHDEPSAEKLEGLREVLASIGIKLPKQGAMRPGLFNSILAAWKARRTRRSSTRSCCAPRRKPNTRRKITAISASTCAATRISPHPFAAMPISSSIEGSSGRSILARMGFRLQSPRGACPDRHEHLRRRAARHGGRARYRRQADRGSSRRRDRRGLRSAHQRRRAPASSSRSPKQASGLSPRRRSGASISAKAGRARPRRRSYRHDFSARRSGERSNSSRRRRSPARSASILAKAARFERHKRRGARNEHRVTKRDAETRER